MQHPRTKITFLLVVVIVIFAIAGCSDSVAYRSHPAFVIDTTKSFPIGNYWATPNESFEFHSFAQSSETPFTWLHALNTFIFLSVNSKTNPHLKQAC